MKNQNLTLDLNPEEYKILVVDDVISNVMLLKALLKTMKYQVVTANDGIQALEMVESQVPDLILLDVMMPGLSGFDVSQKLQASPEYNDIPIIFLTALNTHEDIVKGFQLGANDFITKPFNKNELMIRISHQVSLVHAKRVIIKQTEELRSIIAGRDKLYSVIAHDLRGPLGTIKMVLNLLINTLDRQKLDDSVFDMLKVANQTTEEVFTLLDNLLKWTKSQLGRLNVAFQQINIMDLVRDSMEIFQTTAQLKKVELVLETETVCDVYVDIDMVKTILRNLISNAIKFSDAGEKVVIAINIDDARCVVVSVRDYGCGIKEENQGKLLHSETHYSTFGTQSEEGSGLGLLLCQDFVGKNGGELWFESTEGEGSEFFFSVPKRKTE